MVTSICIIIIVFKNMLYQVIVKSKFSSQDSAIGNGNITMHNSEI